MAKKSPEIYKGVAKFFTYLSRPEVQAKWSTETGYLPVTPAAYTTSRNLAYTGRTREQNGPRGPPVRGRRR